MPGHVGAAGARSAPVVAAALLLTLGCAAANPTPPVPPDRPAAGSAQQQCPQPPPLEAHTFPARPKVDNRYFPLVPGTRWVLQGTVAGSEHRVVTTVTDLTKVIGGVRSVVVFDQDFDADRIQEAELAFLAQDAQGTVWGLGEYPEIYEDGKLTGAPDSWISGVAGARPGIAMPAIPRVGTPTYTQGMSPEIDFWDCATVLQKNQRVCVDTGCFEDVLVTDEYAPRDPEGGHQRKVYAPEVGVVKVEPVGGENPETLELTEVARLDPVALAKARKEALELDGRGYRISPDVYGRTPPAQYP